jgi:superfamily II DNA helicase RecQ
LLLAWHDTAQIESLAAGRDLLLELLPPPGDGTERVNALLDRYAAIQAQRIEEIVAYARSRRCLHGHISNYLGGARRTHCAICNRCAGETLLPDVQSNLPGEAEQLRMILQVLSSQSWGRRTLVYLLRGDEKAGERAQRAKAYGRMNFRSESALDSMIERLIHAGCIEEIPLSHGGVALAISETGRSGLADPEQLA